MIKWGERAEASRKEVGHPKDHYAYGKLIKIRADLFKQRGHNSDTIHNLYKQAADIFEHQGCRIESAAVHSADAAAFYEEGNYGEAETAYGQAQSLLQGELSSQTVIAMEARGKTLKRLGREDEGEDFLNRAAAMQCELQECREKASTEIINKKGQ